MWPVGFKMLIFILLVVVLSWKYYVAGQLGNLKDNFTDKWWVVLMVYFLLLVWFGCWRAVYCACGLMISVLDSWNFEWGPHMWCLSDNSDYCHGPVQNIPSVIQIKQVFALAEYSRCWQLAICESRRYVYTIPVRTPQETHSVSITMSTQLMLIRGVIPVCRKERIKHVNIRSGRSAVFRFHWIYFIGSVIVQGGARNVIPFYHPIQIVTSQYRCCKRASECCSSWKMR